MGRRVPSGVAVVLAMFLWGGSDSHGVAQQPLSADAAAQMLLDSARRGYNEGRFDFACERFREFLRQYGGHKDAPSAQYGLGLSLLELPQKDYTAAISALQQAAGRQEYVDRPLALYWQATAQRALGGLALEQAEAKPNEAGNYRNTAAGQFNEAAKNFAAASEAFAARIKAAAQVAVPASASGELADPEWLLRARCDHCEMLLRLEKFKEASELAQAILADKALERSRFRSLALYHAGYARFALREYQEAGRALSQLAPFQQEFAPHARYLLARVHHLADERPEAAAMYKALLADFEQQKKMAGEAMKNAGALRPEERMRMEAILRMPPDYVLRASFYAALLAAEEGRYGEAMEGFASLAQKAPQHPLVAETQLRQGYCHLQMRNYAEAIRVLQPLHNHPQLADRALWWTARAQAGGADPNNAGAYEQSLRGAIDLLNRAADRAGDAGRNDPEAKVRRGDILLDVADTQQAAKQYREAVATYQKVQSEAASPDRTEEAMQRQATALHLAGQYRESDELCVRFEQTYPKSTLLAAVWFRAAENACLDALAAAADPNQRGRQQELDQRFDIAIKRYQRLIEKFPEFPHVHLARYGMATACYHRRQYREAIAILSAIPDAERMGELAPVSYLLADCYLRELPAETDDALAAAQLIDRAEQAGKLLEKYLGSAGKTPQAADAMLKLGYCQQRIAMVLANPAERQKGLSAARETYERLLREPANPAHPAAVLERAKCQALLGDANGAINELNRFQSDPFRNSPVAPLALVRQANLMRAQNRAADAVRVMAQCRSQYEGGLQNDPQRSEWVPLLQYEHALAVKESAGNLREASGLSKLAEARQMFEATAKQFAGRPEAANASWRAAQCRREEAQAVLAASREAVLRPGLQPAHLAAATKAIEDSLGGLRQTAEFFRAESARWAPPAPGGEGYLRLLYETAWCYRVLAEAEIEAARQKLQAQALDKVLAGFRKDNRPQPALNPPELPLAAVPLQPAEKATRELYTALIAAAGNSPLAPQARLELAEICAQRGENDPALELLAAAMENSPPQEMAERLRLRIGVCLLAKKELKTALAQAQAVLKNPTSTLAGEARLLAGEAHCQAKEWQNAVDQLLAFREQDPFRNRNDLADRALLRLGQAFAEMQRWDESRRSLETLVQRFSQSPWVHEARYGIGWTFQNQNQHDNAAGRYSEVTRSTAAEVAAQAQLQLGLCRLAQKRYADAAKELLTAAFTYDYPELAAAALCEAGQAYVELKQPAEAAKLWQGVVRDHGAGKWAETARQRLSTLKQ